MNRKILRKGQSEYISWILVLGLVVVLSFFLYNWSIQQAQKTSEELEKSTDPITCSDAGFTIESICQNYRTLNINISNTKSRELKGFLVKMVGLYPEDPDYLYSATHFVTIPAGDTERVNILKRGTLGQIELTPIVGKNKKDIYCEEQSVKKEKEDLIYCD